MACSSPSYKVFFYYSVLINIIISLLIGTYLCGRMFHGNGNNNKMKWLNLSRSSLFKMLPRSHNEIIFLGASIIQNCEWAELFSNANIKNRGISGDTTADVIERLGEVIKNRPEKLFIMIGLNDIFQNIAMTDIQRNYRQIVRYIKEHSADTRVHIFTLLPVGKESGRLATNSKISELNRHLKEICEKEACILIDLHGFFKNDKGLLREELTHDGVHLNGAGYDLWRSVMKASTGL